MFSTIFVFWVDVAAVTEEHLLFNGMGVHGTVTLWWVVWRWYNFGDEWYEGRLSCDASGCFNGTAGTALHCKSPGCGSESGSYLCLWNLSPSADASMLYDPGMMRTKGKQLNSRDASIIKLLLFHGSSVLYNVSCGFFLSKLSFIRQIMLETKYETRQMKATAAE